MSNYAYSDSNRHRFCIEVQNLGFKVDSSIMNVASEVMVLIDSGHAIEFKYLLPRDGESSTCLY